MGKELILIGIVVVAGIGVSRLWMSRRKGWSIVLCLLVAALVTSLARRWQIDLSGAA
ncbi:hypothetical protein [Piscinibacter sp. HJYY11]|uniref:hypothetical protein n=1 Tax=Piscinibacter sp. HJYY11 TaxID=2801333 RepID=UPI00191CF2A0|nr:hypothetical protein [Piscinibacter sp. HJYY11]MBL0726229.1 hypothetical protein [Piscinibacter sp. HJYY11]